MVHLFNIAVFFFAAFPYALLPFIVLKIIEIQNYTDDVIAFEAERVIIHTLEATSKNARIVIAPKRKWLAATLLAALTSFGFQTLNAATNIECCHQCQIDNLRSCGCDMQNFCFHRAWGASDGEKHMR